MAEKSRSRAASTAAASTRAPQASGVGVGATADRRKRVALRRLIDEMLIIAAADLSVEENLGPLGKKLRFVLADRDELEHAIESHYPR